MGPSRTVSEINGDFGRKSLHRTDATVASISYYDFFVFRFVRTSRCGIPEILRGGRLSLAINRLQLSRVRRRSQDLSRPFCTSLIGAGLYAQSRGWPYYRLMRIRWREPSRGSRTPAWATNTPEKSTKKTWRTILYTLTRSLELK